MTDLKYDYHVHSTFSPDGKNNMDEICARAVGLGLTGIAFTDHVDVDIFYSGGGTFVIADTNEYVREISRMQEKYAGQLKVLKGLEIGYSPDEWVKAQKYIEDVQPDFIIGSVHVVNHIDPYEPRFFEGFDRIGAFNHYIQAVIDSIEHLEGKVSVVGHLNYLSKYAPYNPREYIYEDNPRLWDELLKKIIKCNLGIEVNSSGIDKCGATLPGLSVLKRYYDLGGRKLVFGSDAHNTDDLFKHYNEVKDMVMSIGFDGFTDYFGEDS